MSVLQIINYVVEGIGGFSIGYYICRWCWSVVKHWRRKR